MKQLQDLGVGARIETTRALGNHWPLVLPKLAGVVAGFAPRRQRALLGTLAAAVIIDDLEGLQRVVRRLLLGNA